MENITGKLMFKPWKLADYVGLESEIQKSEALQVTHGSWTSELI